jgi:hypothetical protein
LNDQVPRTTQTDASVFDYSMQRKTREIVTVEEDKVFESDRVIIDAETQTDMTQFVEVLVPGKKMTMIKQHNLRNRKIKFCKFFL